MAAFATAAREWRFVAWNRTRSFLVPSYGALPLRSPTDRADLARRGLIAQTQDEGSVLRLGLIEARTAEARLDHLPAATTSIARSPPSAWHAGVISTLNCGGSISARPRFGATVMSTPPGARASSGAGQPE
jgi:hypothetical protein